MHMRAFLAEGIRPLSRMLFKIRDPCRDSLFIQAVQNTAPAAVVGRQQKIRAVIQRQLAGIGSRGRQGKQLPDRFPFPRINRDASIRIPLFHTVEYFSGRMRGQPGGIVRALKRTDEGKLSRIAVKADMIKTVLCAHCIIACQKLINHNAAFPVFCLTLSAPLNAPFLPAETAVFSVRIPAPPCSNRESML